MIVNRMITPKVVAVARDLLGCSTLVGPELENQPTTSGSCFGSHWEQRLYPQEMMASTASHNSFMSALTLAALEDSGWCAPLQHAEGVFSLCLSPRCRSSMPLMVAKEDTVLPMATSDGTTDGYYPLAQVPCQLEYGGTTRVRPQCGLCVGDGAVH